MAVDAFAVGVPNVAVASPKPNPVAGAFAMGVPNVVGAPPKPPPAAGAAPSFAVESFAGGAPNVSVAPSKLPPAAGAAPPVALAVAAAGVIEKVSKPSFADGVRYALPGLPAPDCSGEKFVAGAPSCAGVCGGGAVSGGGGSAAGGGDHEGGEGGRGVVAAAALALLRARLARQSGVAAAALGSATRSDARSGASDASAARVRPATTTKRPVRGALGCARGSPTLSACRTCASRRKQKRIVSKQKNRGNKRI